MFSVLILGLLLGLQHAMEADHVAAVASLTARRASLREAARQGAAWGTGHALTLLMVGGAALVAGAALGDTTATALELLVGVMLVGLGLDVLRRQWIRRVHFHAHSHGDDRHFHAHSHEAGTAHDADSHRHTHKLPLRPLLVGMIHGMAGSAALIVFALGSVESIWTGLAYIAVFGIGSIIGMTALAVVISLPLRWSADSLTLLHNGLTAMLGIVTVLIGSALMWQTSQQLLAVA